MKKITTALLICISVGVFGQKKVILDTDPSFDPDDIGCIAMLHTMAAQGECDILAMVNSTNQKESALCISSVNQYYNKGAIPVGDYKGYPEKINATENTFDYHLAREYPRPIKTWEETLDGVKLYREILESAADKSITIVIIGTMHNFYGLLKSEADELSDLSGKQLVEAKVEQVVSMGGNFLDNRGLDRTNWGGSEALCSYTEWSCMNEERNAMCRYVIDNCPAPFIASGWENGNGDYYNANNGNVMSGQRLKELPENHITRKGYEYHFAYRGGDEDIDRHSNDQCALHYAIRGEGKNYTAFLNGQITLTDKGVCTWKKTTNGIQGHIQKNREDELIAQEIEELMLGDIPAFDDSPPGKPENVRFTVTGLEWDASTDETIGSWVVAYHVYHNGKLIHTAHGTKYRKTGLVRSGTYEVRAVNASGTESRGGTVN